MEVVSTLNLFSSETWKTKLICNFHTTNSLLFHVIDERPNRKLCKRGIIDSQYLDTMSDLLKTP